MIAREDMLDCVRRAGLAPTVHNTQPARWHIDEDGITLFCDTDRGLHVGDPKGRDAALSCGAVLEAMVLALSAHGVGAEVDLVEDVSLAPGTGLQTVAFLRFRAGGAVQGLHEQLERRATWRGPFETAPMELFGWTRPDARLVLDQKGRDWLAERNDWASLQIMRDKAFRRELVAWMRLSDRHPRAGLDGMDRAAMQMSGVEALGAPLALGPLWPLLDRVGMTAGLTAEAAVTKTAPVVALFHRPRGESPVESGRAYLRMCLEAASLGMAGWPMAALSDHPQTCEEICTRFGIAPDRRLVQAIRFGRPTGSLPPRARRPIEEILIAS